MFPEGWDTPLRVAMDIPRTASITIRDGMLVVDLTILTYKSGYENVELNEVDNVLHIKADKQVWVSNGYVWDEYASENDFIFEKDFDKLHPSMLALVKTEEITSGSFWWKKVIGEQSYIDSILVRLKNTPAHFKSNNYTIIA